MTHDKPLPARPIASATSSSTALDVPAHLRPSWPQLPALARLVTDRLANGMIHWPVVGPLIRSAANFVNLATLTGAHLYGSLIAYNTEAVMWYLPLHPAPASLITRMRDYLPRMTAFIPVMAAYLKAAAAWITLAAPVAIILAALALTCTLWYAAGAQAMTRWGSSNKSIPRMRRAFDGTGVRFVLACGLARAREESGFPAAVAVLRAVRRAADRQQVTIVANAATSELAVLYQHHGFRPLPTGQRHLVRVPKPASQRSPRG